MGENIVITFGSDVEVIAGTATQPTSLRSRTLRVDGKVPSARKGDTVPTFRLSKAQYAALIDAPRNAAQSGKLVLPAAKGRGRPAKVGTGLAAFLTAARPAQAHKAKKVAAPVEPIA